MAAPRKPPIQPAGGPRRTTSPDKLLHRELTMGGPQAHKQTLDDTLLGELTTAREELARTLRQSYTRALQRTKSFFYTEGDKCGRLLARMINKKPSMTYIARMRDAAGQLHHMPDQIATAVTRFYTDLYAISPPRPSGGP
ncbi:Hypothetical predicted protein [Pelobates cultripes]|uniref:Uncharacterized protein n=1 Tax=Pelobates cultripes TaxID=61616 RepID=A0AAD1W7L7_PELCU|nr:Hypothetical predicted protein [Pelobates cultripes]